MIQKESGHAAAIGRTQVGQSPLPGLERHFFKEERESITLIQSAKDKLSQRVNSLTPFCAGKCKVSSR